MKPPSRVVPVYPTLAGIALLPPFLFGAALQDSMPELEPVPRRGRVNAPWRTWFPFNSPGGVWTFSGRVALYHGLPRLKVPVGSTILVPSYHQGVEIDTLLAAGYRVRYYRLDESLTIDLPDAERRLDGTVSALYVTHYFGFPQPIAAAREFCRAHHLKLIEDCALSLFSRHEGKWLGSEGDLALFSVYKTLPLPHGGFLVTTGESPTPGLRRAPFRSTLVQTVDLVQHALGAGRWAAIDRWATRASRALTRLTRWNRSGIVASGDATWDPRLLAYGASRWITALMRLVDRDRVVAQRRRNFARLAGHLRGEVRCPFPDLPTGTCPLFFPIMVPDKIRFQAELAQLGLGSVNLWDTSHPTCPPDLAAEVSHWRRHCLELPIHQELDGETVDRIATAVLTVSERQGRLWAGPWRETPAVPPPCRSPCQYPLPP